MKKQIKIFSSNLSFNYQVQCNEFLSTLHPDNVKDIQISTAKSNGVKITTIMVVYLTDK